IGRSSLSMHETKHIQLEAPSVFGEVSFFMGTVRSAHVFAITTCNVLELRRKEFEAVLPYFPPSYRKSIMEKFVLNVYPDIKNRLKNRHRNTVADDGGGAN